MSEHGARGTRRRRVGALLAVLATAAVTACGPAAQSGEAAGVPAARATTVAPAVGGAPASSVPPGQYGKAPSISLGNGFYSFPGAAQAWVAAHPNDTRTPLITQRIASHPTALWLTGDESFGNLQQDVTASRAQARTMLLTLYNIPLRWDGISSPSTITLAQYEAWIDRVVATIGTTRAIVILEPDALWFWDRLPSDSDRLIRRNALRYAITALHTKAVNTRTYVDAGTSSGSVTPERMAELMTTIGIRQTAGFAVNVSSYSPTVPINDYAHAIRNALLTRGVVNARYVVDTGRNGASSWNNDWCNPPGQRLGAVPALVLGGYGRDMDLWVKAPGTSDGNCGPAGGGKGTYGGQFLPSVAYKMITG